MVKVLGDDTISVAGVERAIDLRKMGDLWTLGAFMERACQGGLAMVRYPTSRAIAAWMSTGHEVPE
jgi:hypothetical protein